MSENEHKAGAENAKSGKAVILPFPDISTLRHSPHLAAVLRILKSNPRNVRAAFSGTETQERAL